MAEYGNGVGQVAGRASGGNGGGGSSDVGAYFGQLINDSAHTISTLPPGALVAGIVIVFVGLMMLKRVF